MKKHREQEKKQFSRTEEMMDEQHVDEQLEALLRGPLTRWDESIEPEVPALQTIAQLVSTQRQQERSRLWRDLLFFWMVGGVVLLGLLFLLESHVVWFVVVQAAVLAAAVIFVLRYASKPEEGQQWTN